MLTHYVNYKINMYCGNVYIELYFFLIWVALFVTIGLHDLYLYSYRIFHEYSILNYNLNFD